MMNEIMKSLVIMKDNCDHIKMSIFFIHTHVSTHPMSTASPEFLCSQNLRSYGELILYIILEFSITRFWKHKNSGLAV